MSAAVTETVQPSVETAPDVRGPTSPWPLSIYISGCIAITLAVFGTLILQIAWAIQGGSITPACSAAGLVPTHQADKINDARGVCNMVTALRSPAETTVLMVSLVLGAAAIAAGWLTYKKMDTRRKRDHAIAGAVLGVQAVLVAGFLLWFRSGHLLFPFVRNVLNFTYLRGTFHLFLKAAGRTLFMAFMGEAGGIAIGLILSMFTLSKRRVVRAPARTYINFFRGTPLIWQLIFFYAVFTFGLNLNVGTVFTAIIVFALNMGAYSAEVFRAGLQSIERGQLEAARSLGMSYFQAMRYAIVPQAVRRVIPPLMNEFVILIKDTSLIFVLGIVLGQEDLFAVGQEGYSSYFNATFFVGTALGYLAVTLPLIGIVNAAERRLRSGLVGIAGAA
jgi:His/Glu/Gln/Arg/opine family amino acid ABC transporter permease subunit